MTPYMPVLLIVPERGSETARSCGLWVNKLSQVGEMFEKINLFKWIRCFPEKDFTR